ncbi:MAG: methyl-accepting chemotaxis protein, partial [Pseudomonadota bacterium]
MKRVSVRFKLNFTVALIFFIVAAATSVYSYISERQHMLDKTISEVKDMTTFYFDSLNTLMLVGSMDQRAILREKILKRPNVVEARVNRGDPVKEQFGPGFPEEQAVDEWDRQGLQGNEVVRVTRDKDGARQVTVVTPFRATHATRGVDCLQCHTVPEGAVNGAIRITYSMAELDATTARNMWRDAGVKSALFFIGLAVLSMILSRVIVRPLVEMRERIKDIAAGEGDLTKQLDERQTDEVGEVAHWFNTFIAKLRSMVGDITGFTAQLASSAEQMAQVTEQTSQGIRQQQSETEQVATAMNEMSATVQDVARNAAAAAQAAHQ